MLYNAVKMLHVELSGVEGYLSFEDDALPRELFICQFGEEACAPGYGFGPTVRSYYLYVQAVASSTVEAAYAP